MGILVRNSDYLVPNHLDNTIEAIAFNLIHHHHIMPAILNH